MYTPTQSEIDRARRYQRIASNFYQCARAWRMGSPSVQDIASAINLEYEAALYHKLYMISMFGAEVVRS